MPRFFNTSGPCEPVNHYMLPTQGPLPDARRLIGMDRYFILDAPWQPGQATSIAALAASLTAEGKPNGRRLSIRKDSMRCIKELSQYRVSIAAYHQPPVSHELR